MQLTPILRVSQIISALIVLSISANLTQGQQTEIEPVPPATIYAVSTGAFGLLIALAGILSLRHTHLAGSVLWAADALSGLSMLAAGITYAIFLDGTNCNMDDTIWDNPLLSGGCWIGRYDGKLCWFYSTDGTGKLGNRCGAAKADTAFIPRVGFLVSDERERVTFERTGILAVPETVRSFQLQPGNHAFPFNIPLSGVELDTLTGPEYDLEADQDLHGSKSRRGLHWSGFSGGCWKTLQPSQYHLSIPDQAVPYGCTFPLECWFPPRSENITLESVTVEVIEKHDIKFDATAAESVRYNTHFVTANKNLTIFEETHDFSQENTAHEQQISMPIYLPRSLNSYSQTFLSRNIKIEHSLVVSAEFLDRRSPRSQR
ncbi:membrane-associating domain-containing protein [Aspergillus cavernicola]|uniref:Membrane-associating domain-containing protein n=1 Tax=Aspergillus cavernicola TaxID=176166 RepID=A0ABR4IUE6_9EURO